MRAYLLICDLCEAEERSPKDTHKFPGWTELHTKSRPLEEGHDTELHLLLCAKCSDKLFIFLNKEGKTDATLEKGLQNGNTTSIGAETTSERW